MFCKINEKNSRENKNQKNVCHKKAGQPHQNSVWLGILL